MKSICAEPLLGCLWVWIAATENSRRLHVSHEADGSVFQLIILPNHCRRRRP